VNTPVYEKASEWFVEFRSGEPDERTRRAFQAWLKEAPAHMAAYLELSALWDESGRSRAHERWPVEALVEEARRDDSNVVALAEKSRAQHAPDASRRPKIMGAAIAATLVLAAGVWVAAAFFGAPRYSTAIGEQRSIALPDGSTVHLNARSSIRVRYSEGERIVELREGQALFTVAQDAGRPFSVAMEGTRVRSLGTQFDVNRVQTGVGVSVVEGRVAIDGVLLSAGEQAVIGSGGAQKSRRPNVDAAIAWTQRQLVFASTPLADVAEMFNRYNERQLVIRDRALERFEIDGVFSSTDPAGLIQFLRDRPGMEVIEVRRQIVVKRRSGG
jgi:transmembrane sensor